MTAEIAPATLLRKTAQSDEKAASLVASISTVLAKDIIAGRLRPGDDLTSVALSRRFGTSRTSVREALLILASEGLVRIEPDKRPRVTSISFEKVREIYAVRTRLLTLAVELLIKRITDADLTALEDARDEVIAAAGAGDPEALSLAINNVGETIASRSGNATLEGMLATLRPQLSRILNFINANNSSYDDIIHDHIRLVRAFNERDAALASALITSLTSKTLLWFEQANNELPQIQKHQRRPRRRNGRGAA